MMWYQSKVNSIGWARKLWKIFAAIEFLWNILQFIQYLISSILDFLTRKWKWYTTSNIQQVAIVSRHFRKCSSKSSDHSEVVFMCTDRWRSKESCKFYMKVSLVSQRKFIPWKLFLWWKFINQNWYSLYFTCKGCKLIHESQRSLPHPNFFTVCSNSK
jgi:hypothetical protein